MSRTQLFIIQENGDLKLYEEFGNSFRGASLFWHNLWNWKNNTKSDHSYCHDEKKQEMLWRLDEDPDIPRELRIILISTFDRHMIKRENLSKYINAIEKVLNKGYFEDNGHFETYPKVLENLVERKDILGIAWNQTDTYDGYWNIYEECPTCHHHTIKRIYNIFRDKKHQFVFEYLEQLNQIRKGDES